VSALSSGKEPSYPLSRRLDECHSSFILHPLCMTNISSLTVAVQKSESWTIKANGDITEESILVTLDRHIMKVLEEFSLHACYRI